MGAVSSKLVTANVVTGFFTNARHGTLAGSFVGGWLVQEVVGTPVRSKQSLDFAQQDFIPSGHALNKSILLGLRHIKCRGKNLEFVHKRIVR